MENTNKAVGTDPVEKQVAKAPVTEPWKPASMLTVPKEILAELRSKGLAPRWVRKDNVDKSLAEGWIVYKSKSPKDIAPNKTAIDGAPTDGTVQVRGLILMVMPIERVKERDAFFKRLTQEKEKAVVDSLWNAAEKGGGAFTINTK